MMQKVRYEPKNTINYNKLLGRLAELNGRKKHIADALGLTPQALVRYWRDGKPLDLAQIYTICDLLRIPQNEIHIYFPRASDIKPQKLLS